MRHNVVRLSSAVSAGLLGIVIAVSLTGCNDGSASQPDSTSVADAAAAAESARIAAIQAREQELAKREADLAAREQAQRESEAAAKVAAKKAAIAKSSNMRTAAAPANEVVRIKPIKVPAGTQLTVALASDLSSKTAKPGDTFEARLVSDLIIHDRRAVSAGTRVIGVITNVVSGSKAIGAVPTLGLQFDSLELDNGERIPISGMLVQQGKSEKARDTAKILGGAAAGAIIGHQIKSNDTGTIVGGLLGGAAGTVAAKKTGTEVQLAAGSNLTVTLDRAFKVTPS